MNIRTVELAALIGASQNRMYPINFKMSIDSTENQRRLRALDIFLGRYPGHKKNYRLIALVHWPYDRHAKVSDFDLGTGQLIDIDKRLVL